MVSSNSLHYLFSLLGNSEKGISLLVWISWSGLVLSSQLFFVAKQRPDILRHTGHVLLGVMLDSAFAVLLFFELFGCSVGLNVQTIRCLLQLCSDCLTLSVVLLYKDMQPFERDRQELCDIQKTK